MRLSSRKFVWISIGVVLIAVGSLAVSTYLESRCVEPRFTVSVETTVLTEPLTPDGFVDYAAAALRRIAEIPPEDNAARLLLQALGPNGLRDPEQWESACEQLGLPQLPREGDYVVGIREWWESIAEQRGVGVHKPQTEFWDEVMCCTDIPWKSDEHPDVAAWLSANERQLDVAIEASRLTGFREPIDSEDWFYASLFEIRVFAHLLTLRAMHRVANEDLDGAWDDVLRPTVSDGSLRKANRNTGARAASNRSRRMRLLRFSPRP